MRSWLKRDHAIHIKNSFTASFPSWVGFISLSSPVALARASGIRQVLSRHHFIFVMKFPSFLVCWDCCHKVVGWVWPIQWFFCIYWDDYVESFVGLSPQTHLNSVVIKFYVKPTFAFWYKSHFVVITIGLDLEVFCWGFFGSSMFISNTGFSGILFCTFDSTNY